jgi:cytochrome c biogenesis protein CcmG, thiol:disulfide interchange protein DsbE
MWRYLGPAAAFVVLGALFAFTLLRIDSGKLDVHEIPSPLIGKEAPAWSLPTVADPAVRVDSHTLAGTAYLLNVWGTWCAECRAEHTALLELARTGGVPLIGIDWKDERAEAVSYLRELGNPYQQTVSDSEGRVAIDLGVYGAPETFLISADGRILAKHIGAMSAEVWRDKFVPKLGRGGGS